MKKICISFAILLIILSSTVFAESKNARREQLYKETLDEWVKQYIGEDVPENERVTGYHIKGYATGVEDDKVFTPTIYIQLEGISEDSIWDEIENPIYLKFNIVDNEYILESISLYPEKYDEFMEAFEEYEKNKEVGVEVTGIPADVSYVANSNEIDELSNIIFIGSAIVLVIVIVTIIIVKLKKKKK